jgi:hypothetical protein
MACHEDRACASGGRSQYASKRSSSGLARSCSRSASCSRVFATAVSRCTSSGSSTFRADTCKINCYLISLLWETPKSSTVVPQILDLSATCRHICLLLFSFF